MTLPIAQLKQFISQQYGVELGPIELAEILWLAVRMGGDFEDVVESRASVVEGEDANLVTETIQEQDAPATPLRSDIDYSPIADLVSDASSYLEQAEREPEKSIAPLPVKVPDVPALNNRQAISRALRPLLRKVPSKVRWVVDEEATVIKIMEEGIWSPVVRPEPERWLELAIVVEVTSLLEVWRQTIEEFRHLLERHGSFRDVRTWQLQAVAGEKPQLFLQTKNGLQRQPRSPKELLDPGGRRLVLFLSDCTSDGWQSGAILQLLAGWARENPVTIAQLLPYYYWERSALGYGYPVRLRTRLAGALNRDWFFEGVSSRQQQRLQREMKFPVITIQPRSIQNWAQALAAVGEQPITGIVLPDIPALLAITSQRVGQPVLTPKQLVQRFRNTASLEAQQLADILSVLPVHWSVIRLIQKSLGKLSPDITPETSALHLAEIALSGLLAPAAPENGQQQYDFAPGVREKLRGAIPISEAEAEGEKIAIEFFQQFPQAVRDRISEDLKERFQGQSWRWFDAFLVPRLNVDQIAVDTMLWGSFAQVRAETLKQWGGEYAELAEKLRNLEPVGAKTAITSEAISVPLLQTTEFEVITVAFQPEVTLKLFRFDVATLELQQPRFFWQGDEPRLKLKRRSAQAYQFIESLGNNVQLEMVQILAGEFMMGSPQDEIDRRSNESPQHPVTVPEFFMGKYPITRAQWRSIAQQTELQVDRELKENPSSFKGDNLPVENVSWYEVVEFCQRLSKWTGQVYRLPSEAEWEYACRAGTTTPFHFGNTISTEVANYNGNYTYGQGIKGTYREKTTVVGSFKVANAFGLYDMHGNVWEWCQDHYHDSYTGAPADGSEWIDSDAKEDAFRMLRGGGWIGVPRYCRSACRDNYFYPDFHNLNIGFRVVSEAARTS
jgi:formylglycine-generating enzyme required for sulfatase activity